MPFVEIEIEESVSTPETRKEMSDAIHRAMVEVLEIPEDDRYHVFHLLPEGCMFHDSVAFDRPRTSKLMLVTFSFNARPPELKDRLFRVVVERLGIVGVGEDDLALRVIEPAAPNWWVSGRVVDPLTGFDERMKDSAARQTPKKGT